MPRPRAVLDGLWQCLNPSIDIAWLQQASRSQRQPLRAPSQSSRNLRNFTISTPTRIQDQAIRIPRTYPNSRDDRSHSNRRHGWHNDMQPALRLLRKKPRNRKFIHHDLASPQNLDPGVKELIEGSFTAIPNASNSTLYEVLRIMRTRTKNVSRTLARGCLEELIQKRGEPISNIFFYECLLIANTQPDGSADVLRDLIAEMRKNHVAWTQTAYSAALAALAVHPDYLLRNTLLADMKERWIDLDVQSHAYVAVGLLRDGQYELALDKLDQMIEDRLQVPDWVYDTFIYVLAESEHLDDAMRIVQHRLDRDPEGVNMNIWTYLLDACSKHHHLEGSRYTWRRATLENMPAPSEGVATAVLNVAARHGDVALAMDVFEHLASRDIKLRLHHYEALSETYAFSGRFAEALEVLTTMETTGIRVRNASTGGIAQSLKEHAPSADVIMRRLEDIKKKRKVSIPLFNVVLSYMLETSPFANGMSAYKHLRDFCSENPDNLTFLLLLRKCTCVNDAEFLDAEQRYNGVALTWRIHKEHFRIHLHDSTGELEKVKAYFCKLYAAVDRGELDRDSVDWADVLELVPLMMEQLVNQGDTEAGSILDAAIEAGLPEDPSLRLKVRKRSSEVEVPSHTVDSGNQSTRSPNIGKQQSSTAVALALS